MQQNESNLTRNFFKIVLFAQIFVSLLNTLFVLTDQNAIVAFFGFYGMLERKRSVLLAYLAFTAFTACMDLVRILVYYEYISSVLLGFQTSLGYYYMMLISFGLLVKIPSAVFGYLLWRSTPHRSENNQSIQLQIFNNSFFFLDNFRPVEDGF
jgi:hypothetical protein